MLTAADVENNALGGWVWDQWVHPMLKIWRFKMFSYPARCYACVKHRRKMILPVLADEPAAVQRLAFFVAMKKPPQPDRMRGLSWFYWIADQARS